jgi:hypothetical protein
MRVLLGLAVALAATPSVSKLILAPSEVGVGYVLLQRADGVGVKNTVTLDLCGRKGYPSEKLRSTRLQVNYLKRNAIFGLSNEVVTYKPGGAAQAMREAVQHAAGCPHHAIATGDPDLPVGRFTITRIKDSKLLKGYLAVRVRVVGTLRNGKHIDATSYAIYQRLGNVLSGVYSFGANTPAQQRFALHAAEQSAKNLRRGGQGNGPTA